jgi:hypothetical protein
MIGLPFGDGSTVFSFPPMIDNLPASKGELFDGRLTGATALALGGVVFFTLDCEGRLKAPGAEDLLFGFNGGFVKISFLFPRRDGSLSSLSWGSVSCSSYMPELLSCKDKELSSLIDLIEEREISNKKLNYLSIHFSQPFSVGSRADSSSDTKRRMRANNKDLYLIYSPDIELEVS